MCKFCGLGCQVGHIGDGWLISASQCLRPHPGWLIWLEVAGMFSWGHTSEALVLAWFLGPSLVTSAGAEMSKMVSSLGWSGMNVWNIWKLAGIGISLHVASHRTVVSGELGFSHAGCFPWSKCS